MSSLPGPPGGVRRRRRRRRSIGAGASTTASTAAGPTAAADGQGRPASSRATPTGTAPISSRTSTRSTRGRPSSRRPTATGRPRRSRSSTKNKGDFDLTLAGINACEQFKLAGLLEPFDPARVPNIEGVGRGVPQGVPLRHPDRLRQDRLRLPQGPHLRAPHDVEGAVGARGQVQGQDDHAQVRLRHPGDGAARTSATPSTRRTTASCRRCRRRLLELKPNLKAIIDTDFSKALIAGRRRSSRSTTTTTSRWRSRRTRTSSGCSRRRACRPTSRAGPALSDSEAPPRRLGAHGLPPRAEELRVLRQRDGPGLHRAGGRAVHQEVDQGQPDPEVQRGGAEGRRVRGLPRP